MKQRKELIVLAGLIIGLVIAGLAEATNYVSFPWPWGGNQATQLTNLTTTGDTRVQGTLLASGNVEVDGVLSPTTYAPPATHSFLLTASSVSLTSPTVQFSVTGKYYITLNSDANQTAFRPTDGTTGQIIIICAGSGSNTMQFDDNSATISLGGNRVLTEGNFSTIALICTAGGSGTASTWAQLYYNAN